MYEYIKYKNKINLRCESHVHSLICPIKDDYCCGKKCMAWEDNIDEKYGHCKLIENIA